MGTSRKHKFDMLDVLPGFMIAMVIGLGFLIYKNATTPIEAKRYELVYNGETVKCQVEFPHYPDGKMSRWGGTVNLKNCEDGKDYLGATNVQVVKYPECGCGG